MAKVPEKTEDLIQNLKKLTLQGIKPLTQELGRGAYGRVYQVKYRGVICAAKEVHLNLLQYDGASRLRENFEAECIRCSELTHPNIVHFMGIYYPNRVSLPVMIMELMDDSLTNYVQKSNISLKRKISILHDVAEGLNYLHSRNPPVIHRDLSPNNILLKDMPLLPVAKIADLGVAKVIQADSRATKNQLTKVPGTADFMPPEALVDNPKYGLSLDVFSYGGIMLHTVNQEWPTPKPLTEFDPVTRKIKGLSEVERRKEYLDKMTGEAEELKPLVEDCLDNDPAMRPPISHLSKKIKPLKESPPLVPALQSDYFQMTWEKCADLPFSMYCISAALHSKKVYIMAGSAASIHVLYYVYCYNLTTNKWEQLPPPGHYTGVLQIIDDKLVVIGGVDNVTNNRTNKVSTYIDDKWTNYFPNLLRPRNKPGVVSNAKHVIVAGGKRDDGSDSDDIELLNVTKPFQWIMTSVRLPKPMYDICSTIADNMLYIMGRGGGDGSTIYKLAVEIITSSTMQHFSKNQTVQWIKLPPTSYLFTTLLPHVSPPVVIGGVKWYTSPNKYSSIADIAMLDVSNNTWTKIASLSSPRGCATAIPIDSGIILVIGGFTGANDITEILTNAITVVEKGRATRTQTEASIPEPTGDKSNNQCHIQ